MNQLKILVMGVSGSGKTLVGQQLAATLGLSFLDADAVHSTANIQKMANGIPLSDTDRRGWLQDLAALIQRESGLVLACSALKRSYREQLRAADPGLLTLYLQGDFDTIWSRHAKRQDHYFNGESMLVSQFEQLEEPGPDEAAAIDIRESPAAVLQACLAALRQQDKYDGASSPEGPDMSRYDF
ncbi:gluconokinase [Marinobacter caseinilyticus]|uniref:gluconokinase n=1 Tax=Marinobacter caseinilyticus TaxID=2692195 RepID=UPI00140CB115|nr:gluconokinase [Marinobacter caseinilyticus]